MPKHKPQLRSQAIYTITGLNQWIEIVRQHMSHLSQPQSLVLAWWSFGMVLAQSCGLTSVSHLIAELTQQKGDNVRQRLREWNWDRGDKAGDKRQDVAVSTCFVPLLRWVLSWWDASERRLWLAMDATTLSDRYVILVVSVVYRACAIPIAWKVFATHQQSPWQAEWLRLFAFFQQAIPSDWTVLVMADRGLYAPWLFAAIQELGWHPFLRINTGGKYRAEGSSQFLPLQWLAARPGTAWSGRVTCFKKLSLQATLLVRWEEGYADPWLILTDLDPWQADIAWYAARSWIECGFRQTKRAGWQWHQTRITDPARAARHWLSMAVATLWVVSVGSQVDASLPASTLDPFPPTPRTRPRHSQPRLLSCFRLGIHAILVALIQNQPLPHGSFNTLPRPFY